MYYHRVCLITALLLIHPDDVLSLEIYELLVPAQVPLGKPATMTCRWQLDANETLYSVKWYKDGKEFFAHFPKGRTPRRSFPLPGVYVEMSDKTGSSLTLAPVEMVTSGRYRCEISGERPQFLTVASHADMQVVILPTEGPVISGFVNYYQPDELLSVTCVTGKSKPPTRLTWFLNNEPVLPNFVGHPHELQHEGGLMSTSLDLEFRTKEEHFVNNILRIKCFASIGTIYQRSVEQFAKKWTSKLNTSLIKSRRAMQRGETRLSPLYKDSKGACVFYCSELIVFLSVFLLNW